MLTIEQKTKLPVKNFDVFLGSGTQALLNVRTRHGPLLPDSIRCITCGPSNSGKTNVIFNLLFHPNGLKFENVYLISKSLYQPKYRLLEKVMFNLVGYYPYDDNAQVPHPSEIKPNSVVIFDDVACLKQDKVRDYFTMGRHNALDIFYIGQTYSRIPKQLIRDNTNFLILFKQDDTNLKHIYADHVNTDMKFEQFKILCSDVWNADSHGFVVIDKESAIDKGRYRRNFDSFLRVS